MTIRLGRLTPEIGGWLALLCCAPFLLLIPVTNDSAWQMWLGRQMLHGANLYTDLVEVNPPLWFWMAVPLAWISEALALPSRTVLIAFLLLTIAWSYWLCTALIRDWPIRRRWAFIIGFLLATIPIALRIFTQREHFVLVATIPYVLLCSARDEGKKISLVLSIAVAALAALGFAIKPFFALVPIALECWLWRKAPRLRPETITLGLLAVAYAVGVFLFEQDFVDSIPTIRAAYDHFYPGHLEGTLIASLIFGLAFYSTIGADSRSAAFQIAGLTFLLAFLMQGKGWLYQALPALGSLIIAVSIRGWGKSAIKDAFAFSIVMILLWMNARLYSTDRPFTFPRGASVSTLTVGTLPVWPQVEERGYEWPLHAFSIWQLPAIDVGALPAAPVQRRLANDLRCNPPEYLLVDQSPAVRDFLESSEDLTEVLSHYKFVRSREQLGLHHLVVPFSGRPAGCRTIHSARPR